MPGLKEVQRVFTRHLLSGDAAVADYVADGGRLDARARLAVYTNAYYARLVEALASDYRALSAMMGEQRFEALCHDYIRAQPSTFFSLRWFGRGLAEFVAARDADNDSARLAALARFEWALVDAFDAADVPPLVVDAVAALPPDTWPTLRLVFHPSVGTLSLAWNTLEIWKAVRAGAAPPPWICAPASGPWPPMRRVRWRRPAPARISPGCANWSVTGTATTPRPRCAPQACSSAG
ncbi:MAG: DNA-binding domain-containing protein [Gammaproteobacteria bacterium]